MASAAGVHIQDVILSETEEVSVLKEFKDVIKQEDWLNVPNDDRFLLRFLRIANYDVKTATQLLVKNWTCRADKPEWFSDVDPANEKIQAVIKKGKFVVSPKLDKHGRKVVLVKLNNNSQSVPVEEIDTVYKAFCLLLEWINADKDAQTNGIAYMIDCSQFSDNRATQAAPQHVKAHSTFTSYFQQGNIAQKVKVAHVYRQPEAYIMWSLMFNEREDAITKAHGASLVGIYEDLGMEVIPEEYLPDEYDGPSIGTCDQVIAGMIEDMNRPDFRNYIKSLSSIRCNPKPSK